MIKKCFFIFDRTVLCGGLVLPVSINRVDEFAFRRRGECEHFSSALDRADRWEERGDSFLNGESVDRIPNGFGACETAGLHAAAYHTLKKVLGVKDTTNRFYTFII